MSTLPHRSHVSHPISLSTGQVLGAGEVGEADPEDPHDVALIEAGHLVAVPPPTETAPPPRSRRKDPEGGPT